MGWVHWSRRMEATLQDNRDIFLDLVRIYLGIALFVRGLYFTWNTEPLSELLLQSGRLHVLNTALAHYIPIAHMGGGLLLAMGFMTRTAAIFQLPILFGAVFLVHWQAGLFTTGQDLEVAALVLFLLLLITVFGAGRWSVDHALVRRRSVEEELEEELGEEPPGYVDERPRHPVR